MALVKLEKITKLYNEGRDNQVAALKEIDLEIDQGEFVAIMGASGSGKSTLMHVIGFLDRATSGKYFFDGRDVTGLNDNELAQIRNEQIGFVFQAFNLLARTSALDNVALPMLYASQKAGAEKMRERATELLGAVGLGNRLGHVPSELSGGQQQRVAIARALVNDPAVIFADEPTGNLDSRASIEIMELFERLNKEGRTLIFVTHEDSIAHFAKRIIKLKDGEIISDEHNGHRKLSTAI